MESWPATARHYREYLLSSQRSPQTAVTYISSLHGFWLWCSKYEISPYHAERTLIREWVSDRLAQVAAQRVNTDLAALRAFYAMLRDQRERDDNPADGIHAKKAKVLPTKPLEADEVNRLLGYCKGERDRLIILVMAYTGMRISEVAKLEARDINWRSGLVKVHGKGAKEREVALPADVLGRLHAFVTLFPDEMIWYSRWGKPLKSHQIRKILYGVAKAAEVPGVHPHRLRSTFATGFMNQHGDIQALQAMMGHEDVSTTARYSEYTAKKRGLQQMRTLDLGLQAAG